MSRRLRIAVADDESFVRDYLSELLPRLGHEPLAARDGRELLELCRRQKPDLVITDIKMPELDGLTAAEEVNREGEVPVILLSAHHDPELRARALRGPAMAYLAKPVREEDLRSAIDLSLSRFEQLRQARREAAELRQSLEDRKVLERAKGVVGRRLGVGEQEAFGRLRKYSSDRNLKMVEVARRVLESEEVFRQLEASGTSPHGPQR
jgi:response regulator NasT